MEKAIKNHTAKRNTPCLLGAHFSIAGGLEKALYQAAAYECTALQLFTQNANTWKERKLKEDDIHRFQEAMTKTAITEIAAHTSYLINIASPDAKKHERSCRALEGELRRSSQLHIPYVILHPGSHMGSGEKEGIQKVAESINRILSRTSGMTTRLLLETTAGQGHVLGRSFEQLAAMLEGIEDGDRMGICLDTSHIFAAGYDIRTENKYRAVMILFKNVIGFERLFFLHLNDSKRVLGSRVDRHEHIGEGCIGLDAFASIMSDDRLFHVPKVIETPKGRGGKDYDKINLDRLKSLGPWPVPTGRTPKPQL